MSAIASQTIKDGSMRQADKVGYEYVSALKA